MANRLWVFAPLAVKWRLGAHDRFRRRVRPQEGRHTQPTAAVLKSQSVKTTDRGGAARGFDAGKHIFGRKRHILVATLGLLLLVVVHAAGVQDREGARLVLATRAHRASRLRRLWADGGYSGKLVPWVRKRRARARLTLEIVKRPAPQSGFVVLPRRGVVERTFAWLSFQRQMSKNYEYLPATFIRIVMIRLMLTRLTQSTF